MFVQLSVLVPSIHTRHDTFAHRLQAEIFKQRDQLPDPSLVEVIVLTDTMNVTIGEKRNQLLGLAHGEYVVFVDDDDRLEPDYLASVLTATASGADVITFHVSVKLDGGRARRCRYSLEFTEDRNTPTEYQRLPNHICATKRELAIATSFPERRFGEDSDYAARLRPRLTTEHNIPKVLYHYDFNTETTATQQAEPVADVVILSKAATPQLQAMTQQTVTSCIAGAKPHRVTVTVLEQVEGVTYSGAITVHRPGAFNYNQFANEGAARGNAPWIVTANNDLYFEAGWLAPLITAAHPVMSPLNPGDRRQRNIGRNTLGTVNGTHFSGWCFMISRQLWDSIGRFDADTVAFWASDDVVIEQVTAAGITPMLVPRSRVRHLTSRTLRIAPDDNLTWADLHRFNVKYGRDKFAADPRYLAWMAVNVTQPETAVLA